MLGKYSRGKGSRIWEDVSGRTFQREPVFEAAAIFSDEAIREF